MTARLALIALYTVVSAVGFGTMLLSGNIVLEEWVLWGILIASGNLIYTKVWHNNEVETISLVMTFILIAIQSLGWPQIALATIVGVGFGEVFLTKRAWYKKLYNVGSVTIAGVLTEVAFTYSTIPLFHTIVGTAILFDVTLYLLLVPIWLRVAKQTPTEIVDSYFNTIYVIPASAALAWLLINVSDVYGNIGIMVLAVSTVLLLKPEYRLRLWLPKSTQ